jgi:hypothetical protein
MPLSFKTDAEIALLKDTPLPSEHGGEFDLPEKAVFTLVGTPKREW